MTTDNKILLGVKDSKISDQTDIGLIGAGFVGRRRTNQAGELQTFLPNDIGERVKDECNSETAYLSEDPFDLSAARALAVINGSNTDTTLTIYFPLKVHSKLVDLGNKEHNELILLDATPEAILELAKRREIRDGRERFMAADHCIGSLEAYLLAREAGLIVHPYAL